MKWTHIYFDLDNTLYDHELAFQKTIEHCAQQMLNRKGSNITPAQWFRVFKTYCDHYWDNYEKGTWSRDTYQIQRYCSANDEFNLTCSEEEALAFQKEYQSKVASFAELYSDASLLLSRLQLRNVHLGIITNGRKQTQMAKIKALNIPQWFPMENIFISEEVGLAKPELDLFNYVMNEKGSYLYIGDTWKHDIEPALEAGFDAVYFNSRNEDMEQSTKHVPEVSTYKQLLDLFHV
ncbi:HAD family hydrolase [Alkalihalobacillus macyae]|uniref:HAD family hydrolase n=1 Tax=Guptibacillus hwajinpoensis TaxID=208199 RepID=UPI00273B0EA4|nr:HAD family hydrolase [Alkalihalobacillus macyae]MDP4550254.1 HAD family hydrolase [Alkalihalobacillus macyae]